MTKSDLARAVATKAKTTTTAAESVVNLIFNSMKAALVRGERIEIRGFASFAVREYDGYLGRNPKSAEKIQVKPKRLPAFKAGKELAKRINSTVRIGDSTVAPAPEA